MRDVYSRSPRMSAACSICWRAPGGQCHVRVGDLVRHFRPIWRRRGETPAAAVSSPPTRDRQGRSRRAELPTAGLSELVDLRVGDAFETLKSGVAAASILLLSTVEGSLPAHAPSRERAASPRALGVADDLAIAPARLPPTSNMVRQPARIRLVELPLGDRIEGIAAHLSIRAMRLLIPP